MLLLTRHLPAEILQDQLKHSENNVFLFFFFLVLSHFRLWLLKKLFRLIFVWGAAVKYHSSFSFVKVAD